MRANTSAAIEFAFELAATKSLSEIAEHSGAHARQRFDASFTQNRGFWGLAQTAVIETVRPITTSISKTFGMIASSQEGSRV